MSLRTLSSHLRMAAQANRITKLNLILPAATAWMRPYSTVKKFTKDHEWIQVTKDGVTTFGFTHYGQGKYGDILMVEFQATDKDVKRGDVIGFIENLKSAPDIMAPVSGRILRLNESLTMTPSILNSAPETDGWIGQIQMSAEAEKELEEFLEEHEYKRMCDQQDESWRMAKDKYRPKTK
ncbi:hypothetical protein CPB97_009040 [Podila verticillata]|nr:hypothetical protein CPB97_009040 [Podila verticillata]